MENTASNIYSIVACLFVAPDTCLLSRYQAVDVLVGHHVTILNASSETGWEHVRDSFGSVLGPVVGCRVHCNGHSSFINCSGFIK
jgi:hypothetical protein